MCAFFYVPTSDHRRGGLPEIVNQGTYLLHIAMVSKAGARVFGSGIGSHDSERKSVVFIFIVCSLNFVNYPRSFVGTLKSLISISHPVRVVSSALKAFAINFLVLLTSLAVLL